MTVPNLPEAPAGHPVDCHCGVYQECASPQADGLIFLSDEMSWEAVIRPGNEPMTEDEAREALRQNGAEFDGCELRPQEFLEGDRARSGDFERVFIPVPAGLHAWAYQGWVLE